MIVVLAGGSGLLGGQLRVELRAAGHQVRQLVRREVRSAEELQWHPERGELDPATLRGADAVVALSGAGIADHRWDADYQRLLTDSRVGPVTTLARTLTELRRAGDGPAALLSASAVGYYGDTGDTLTTEDGPVGTGFLASLCRQWEQAAESAVGVRVVTLRTGLVLSRHGGLLARLRPLARAGLAGRLGTGRQYWPWISLQDELAAITFVLEHPDIAGPVNLTGPRPVTNTEFVAATSRVLRRPQPIPVPGFALRAVLGGFADEGVLAGQRAVPAKLAAHGFSFTHGDVDSALRYALAR